MGKLVSAIAKISEEIKVRRGTHHRCFVCGVVYDLRGQVVGGQDEGVCSDSCYTRGWNELLDEGIAPRFM